MRFDAPNIHGATHPPAAAIPGVVLGDLYLRLLRPDRNGGERLRWLREAALAYRLDVPGSAAALEQLLAESIGRSVRLSEPQLHALRRFAGTPAFAVLSPWSGQEGRGEALEMLSASGLHELYLALLKPDGELTLRFKAVQAAAAVYEPEVAGSRDALDRELSALLGRPVRLSEPQLRCFKELLVDEPAFAHIAPWEDLTASW